MKTKNQYVCQNCGQKTVVWYGKCPGCGSYNSLIEEIVEQKSRKISAGESYGSGNIPQEITEIASDWQTRFAVGINEWDAVVGGGLVPHSLTLLSGEPGVGKSTLILQVAAAFAERYGDVLYISGEESVQQIRLRAERLHALRPEIKVLSETDLSFIEKHISDVDPKLVIIDSMQTINSDELESSAGSVSQVRFCAARIMRIAKVDHRTVILIGHVTKDGGIAGPRILEHIVDTVLQFEGDRNHLFRILRAVKNRFGSTNELGMFEMSVDGLREVTDPANLFYNPREAADSPPVSGSAITAAVDGIRPMMIEIQALAAPTGFSVPRRIASGIDYNRISMILAILEKRLDIQTGRQDVYVNAVGGIRIDEPAIDLAVALAIVSSLRNHPLDMQTIIIGEIGLTGEIRPVNLIEKRISEAEKLGFKKAVIPYGNLKQIKSAAATIKIIGVKSIAQAAKEAFKE